ncbi:hypothetical protein ACFC4S_23270 [Priestia megaterium]|uniref:hypothetical protein n=1 Tax=Priestia megaterium TaxID=1404 RepID=UPI0035DB0A36
MFKMFICVPEVLFLAVYLAVAAYNYLRPKKETNNKWSIKAKLILWIILIAANIFAIPTIGGVLSLIWDFSFNQIMMFTLSVVCPNATMVLSYWVINTFVSNNK